MAFIESKNHLDWERPLRSSSPIIYAQYQFLTHPVAITAKPVMAILFNILNCMG